MPTPLFRTGILGLGCAAAGSSIAGRGWSRLVSSACSASRSSLEFAVVRACQDLRSLVSDGKLRPTSRTGMGLPQPGQRVQVGGRGLSAERTDRMRLGTIRHEGEGYGANVWHETELSADDACDV